MSREADEAAYADERKKQAQSRKKYRFFYNFLMGAFNGFINNLSAMPRTLIATTLWEGFVLASINYLRQRYLDLAASYYTENTVIQSDRERKALIRGTAAVTYLGYLKSFFSLSAWRHLLAFAAGLQHATFKNEEVLDNIMQRTPYAQRSHAIKLILSQNRSYLPFTSPVTLSKWIKYENKIDLKRQLQAFILEYQENTAFLNQGATITFTKDNANDLLPDFFVKRVALVLADNACIKKVDNTEKYFTDEEEKTFNASIAKSAKEQQRRRTRFLNYTAIGALLSGVLCLYALPPFTVALTTLFLASALGAGSAYIRQSYLDTIASYYDVDTLKQIDDPTRIQALKNGVDAATTSWSNALLMHFKYATLRHPIDAQIGMEYGLREHKVAAKIRKLIP